MNEQMQASQTSGGPGSDPGQANPPINLFVKATPDGKGVEWKLDFKNPPEQSKAKVELPPKSGSHEIVFHLVATQGLDIDFNTDDPIWVVEGSDCPQTAGINTDQIIFGSCIKNLLRITDKNDGDARTLTYQLNFVGAEPLDPEIKNGGNN